MQIPLRQSTAGQIITLGQFVDATDGSTTEDALSIANTDIKLHKWGGTAFTNKNSGGGTFIANGVYYATLDATDTNTIGPMPIYCTMAGARPFRLDTVVMDEPAYDALYAVGGTDYLPVDVTQIAGSTTAATRQSNLLLYAINQTTVAASPAPTTSSFAGGLSGGSYLNQSFRGGVIVFLTGPNAALSPRTITSFTSSSGLFVVSPAFTQTPTAGEAFMIVGTSS